MSDNLRLFISSLQDPDQGQTDDQAASQSEDVSSTPAVDPAPVETLTVGPADDASGTSDDDDGPQELVTSAQAGDIESALRAAGLWEKTDEVAKLLPGAGVPDTAKVYIKLKVDKKLNVQILVTTAPPGKGGSLQGTLNQKYSAAMKAALQKAKLNVTDTIELSWMKFE